MVPPGAMERRFHQLGKLMDLKASNPVEVAEYAVANNLLEEPALKWWVPHVLCRRNRIISPKSNQGIGR
jgi:hypothetical protein